MQDMSISRKSIDAISAPRRNTGLTSHSKSIFAIAVFRNKSSTIAEAHYAQEILAVGFFRLFDRKALIAGFALVIKSVF